METLAGATGNGGHRPVSSADRAEAKAIAPLAQGAIAVFSPSRWSSPSDTNAVANDWLKSFNAARLAAIVAESIKNSLALRYAAAAAYGSTGLAAFREVLNALTNDGLIMQRLQFDQAALRDRTNAVRIRRIHYPVEAIDLLSVLQLQANPIASDVSVIKPRNMQLANRIHLHLVLGGSFKAAPGGRPLITRTVHETTAHE